MEGLRLLVTQTKAKLSRMVGVSAISLVTNDLTTDKQIVSFQQTKNSRFEGYITVPVCETAVFLGAAKILLTLRGLFR